jgi:hypothetical protein
MTDVLDRLSKALADRYAIERELGAEPPSEYKITPPGL